VIVSHNFILGFKNKWKLALQAKKIILTQFFEDKRQHKIINFLATIVIEKIETKKNKKFYKCFVILKKNIVELPNQII
jgi:hypothetical protein